MNLNKVQKEIVCSEKGPALIIAGAGTGKTRVLISRIIYLINNLKIDSNKILAITFTNKAAIEMKERIISYSLSKEEITIPWINTFHAFCLKFLRYEIKHLDYKTNFTIIDDLDKKLTLNTIYQKNKLEKEILKIDDAIYYIDAAKSQNIDITKFIQINKFDKNLSINQCKTLQFVYKEYAKYLKENNMLDFNDLLNLTYKIFVEFPEIKDKWSNRFEYILIDEFQDTDSTQYFIVSSLAKKHNNIFVVGDPDQSIYSWRGANSKIIDIFKSDFPNYKVYILEENYRSTQQILNVANDIIINNNNLYFKKLFSNNKIGPLVQYHHAKNQDFESLWISRKIKDLHKNNIPYKNITILYRSNFLSRNIEQALINNQIPYYIYGGFKFYQRKEIKDLIAYLKVIDSNDEISLLRIINSPSRKVSDKTINKLHEFATNKNISFYESLKYVDNLNLFKPAISSLRIFYNTIETIKNKKYSSIFELLKDLIDKTHYMSQYDKNHEEDRYENVKELLNSIKKYEEEHPLSKLNDFLQDIQLYTNNNEEIKKDCVKLMTVHMAKGLEFDNVFILGLVENIFPSLHFEKDNNEEKIKEERRIMYVAVTRAKEQLFLTSSGGLDYTNSSRIPSRFIDEINPNNLEKSLLVLKNINSNELNDEWFDSKKTNNYYQNNYYSTDVEYVINEVIQHKNFGKGIVVEIKERTIIVAFEPKIGTKEILKNHKSIIRKTK